jgi:hypothetical protein
VACDGELDGSAIRVTVGGQQVEVCGEACAQALDEAQTAAGLGFAAGRPDIGTIEAEPARTAGPDAP